MNFATTKKLTLAKSEKIEFGPVQRFANLVDLVKRFPTNIYLYRYMEKVMYRYEFIPVWPACHTGIPPTTLRAQWS